MASAFAPLADYLFGVDPIDDSQRRAQEAFVIQQSRDYAAREQADYVHQQNYGRMLLDTIHGVTPSVAGLQLGQGLDQINRQGQSAVAGASGNNAALTGYGALLNTGNTAAQFEQAKAIQRAQEIQAAQIAYGKMLESTGARSAGLATSAATTGLGYGQLGSEIQSQNQKAQAAALGSLYGSAGAALGGIIGGPTGSAVGSKVGGGSSQAFGASPSDVGAAGSAYSGAQPGYEASNTNYGSALTAGDQPQDPYQASYSNGLYRGPSNSVGQR